MPDIAPATQKVDTIVPGNRYRKVLGDVQSLAQRLAPIGVLHPVVIPPDNRLVAGARRLAAAQQLGWTEIPVRVVDLTSLLQAEHDENVLRADFTVVERARIGMALEKEIAAGNAAQQREAGKQGGRGKKKDNSTPQKEGNLREICPKVSEAQKTTSQVGKAVGMRGKTYAKARAILSAAEQDPERYGDLAMHMEVTGKVDKAYKTLQVRSRLATIPGAPRPAEWISQTTKDWLELCLRLGYLNDNLAASAEEAAVVLVQLSDEQLDDITTLFMQAHALIGAWLQEIAALRGGTP